MIICELDGWLVSLAGNCPHTELEARKQLSSRRSHPSAGWRLDTIHVLYSPSRPAPQDGGGVVKFFVRIMMCVAAARLLRSEGRRATASLLVLVLAWDLPGSCAFGTPSAFTCRVSASHSSRVSGVAGGWGTQKAGTVHAAAVSGNHMKRVQPTIAISCSSSDGQKDGASGRDDRGDSVPRQAVMEKLEQSRYVLERPEKRCRPHATPQK